MSDSAAPSVPRSAGRALGQGGRDGGFAPATDDAERDLVAGLVGPDGGDHLAVVLDRLAVDGDHQVAGLDAGLGRRAVRGDLLDEGAVAATGGGERRGHAEVADLDLLALDDGRGRLGGDVDGDGEADADVARSEEHTSELQSHSDLVCRLLLEKKKKKIKNIISNKKKKKNKIKT